MGIRVRTKNHKVVDEFPNAEKVRKAAKQLAIFVKANREEYKSYNKGAVVNIVLPGDTRVAGNISMFETIVRNLHGLKQAFAGIQKC